LVLILFGTGADSSAQATAIRVAAISALFSAIGSFGTLAQANIAQHQREEATRPSVIAYSDLYSGGEINLRVENIGNSPAANIKVKFGDPFPTGYNEMPLGFFDNPISFLPPGGSVRQYFGYAHTLLDDDEPHSFHAAVEYQSVDKRFTYEDEYELNLEYLRSVQFPERSFRESVDEIARAIRSAASRESGVRGIYGPPSQSSSLHSISRSLSRLADAVAPEADDPKESEEGD
jgi:hypothetical protein